VNTPKHLRLAGPSGEAVAYGEERASVGELGRLGRIPEEVSNGN
jgi:hypothetical protein